MASNGEEDFAQDGGDALEINDDEFSEEGDEEEEQDRDRLDDDEP
jgi:hypothetical protein